MRKAGLTALFTLVTPGVGVAPMALAVRKEVTIRMEVSFMVLWDGKRVRCEVLKTGADCNARIKIPSFFLLQ